MCVVENLVKSLDSDKEFPGFPLHEKETSKDIYQVMNLIFFLTKPNITQ